MGLLGVGVVGHEVAGGRGMRRGPEDDKGRERERKKRGMVEERESEARLVVLFVALLFFSLSLPRLLALAALLWPCRPNPQGGKRRTDGKRRAGGEQTQQQSCGPWAVGGGEGEAEAKGGREQGAHVAVDSSGGVDKAVCCWSPRGQFRHGIKRRRRKEKM